MILESAMPTPIRAQQYPQQRTTILDKMARREDSAEPDRKSIRSP
jgi:hypothetical protein